MLVQKAIRTLACGLLACSLITPRFASAAETALPFDDIGKHWAKTAIVRGVKAGLFAADENTQRFYPEREMTRAEFLTLLDRLMYEAQHQLYPLTFLSEHEEYGRGEGYDEPYLPYTDVDRLTWMYGPILRVAIVLERLYGPEAIQQVFPGRELHPQQPITRGEAARLLQLFTLKGDDSRAWEAVTDWGWLEGETSDRLKRGEAAVIADKVFRFVQDDVLFPLLDYDGQKFPIVPDIPDVFPLFATYTDRPSADEQTYIQSVEAIRNHEDDEQTFAALKKLAQTSFPNQIGVHYYLSWDPGTSLQENMEQAFAAIDAYFADKIILPDTLRLLAANVYDIALQLENEDPSVYGKTLDRLLAYEKRIIKGSEEWQSLAIYLAAFEVKSGKQEDALLRYQSFAATHPEALLNAVYYLTKAGRLSSAEKFLAELKLPRHDDRMFRLHKVLTQELATLQRQSSYVTDLAFTLHRMENAAGYKVNGESMLSGFLFKYAREVDQQSQISRTTGFYQSPDKLVPEKLAMYTDERNHVQYLYDADRQTWLKSQTDSVDYLHEWVEGKNVYERARELHARYVKQSFGRYDVITEWIPGEALREKAKGLYLGKGRVKQVPVYMNKYYIDRETDQLVRQVWRYEEIYDSGEYVAYVGEEAYEPNNRVRVLIPQEISKGAAGTR
jgi:hypothetical protein